MIINNTNINIKHYININNLKQGNVSRTEGEPDAQIICGCTREIKQKPKLVERYSHQLTRQTIIGGSLFKESTFRKQFPT